MSQETSTYTLFCTTRLSDCLLNPPVDVFLVFLALVLIILRLSLRKDLFFTLTISTAVALASAETVCRLTGLGGWEKNAIWKEDRNRDQAAKNPYQPDGTLLYRYPDNPRGYFDDNEVAGSVNSLGFRGPETTIAKAPDTIRVALLGDSFTLGIGVRDEDTLPANLGRALGEPFEALNFVVSGTNTPAQIRLLKHYTLSFEPDVVVIVLFPNDAGRTGTVEFLAGSRVLKNLRRHSFFLNGLFDGVDRVLQHRRMIRRYRAGYEDGDPGWEAVQESLAKAAALAAKKDFELVVALYPVLFRLDDRHPFLAIHHKVGEFCQSRRIPFVDLLDVFLGQKDSEMWVHRVDQHPNEVAHRIAGEGLAEFLRASGLLTVHPPGSGAWRAAYGSPGREPGVGIDQPR